MVKNLPTNVGDEGSIPGLGRTPGGGNGNFQARYSCLENLMDRGTSWATVHEIAKSNQTQLSMHAHKVSSSISRDEEINTDLLWACALQHDCYGLNLTPQNSYIEALTLSSSECICIWRQGL